MCVFEAKKCLHSIQYHQQGVLISNGHQQCQIMSQH
jgi:hypothetical protein